MTLKDLRARAEAIGIQIKAERFSVPIEGSLWGYWLVDEATGKGPWDDDNYCADKDELSDGLAALEIERAAAIPKWTAQHKADLAALAAGKSVPVRWRVF
jgi:hypothetical protein